MTVKLFQDVAGTIPAVLAGQPVGYIKRIRGSDDAKQATALSKPTYARWPKTGARNLANYAQDYSHPSAWLFTTQNGVTREKVGSGIEDGIPYLDVRYHGIPTTTFDDKLYSTSFSYVSAVSGTVVHGGAQAKLIANPLGLPRVRLSTTIASTSSDGVFIGQATSPKDLTAEWQSMAIPPTPLVFENMARARVALVFNYDVGVPIDVTIRIRGLYFGLGLFNGFQFNYGPNDIRESGVPDLWHLYNDGGDSLNVTLPAGTYGLASIGIDRQIIVTTFVSDGTTPVNILRHERQLNVSYRLGAYSAAEELAIRDAWGRKYA